VKHRSSADTEPGAPGGRPSIFCKLSPVLGPIDGQVRTDPLPHMARLDQLFETFGEDWVMFGSDWPNRNGAAPIHKAVALARAYFADKPVNAQERYFWRNSRKGYRWVARSAVQKALV
jgi:L-fuconolactonase